MKRRTLLTGVGASALGSTAIVASGAFTRTQSQRRVTIEVAHDTSAYLNLDECPENDHDDVVDFTDGHLEVKLDAEASTVNWYDTVFQICNHGKSAISVWIEADVAEEIDNDDRVWFYNTDNQDEEYRVDSEEDAFDLEVGDCKCIGIRADASDLENVQLLEDDEIVVHGDVELFEDSDS